MTNTNYPSATPNPQPRGSNNKSIVIGVLAAALLGTWGYWLYKNNQSAQETDQRDYCVEADLLPLLLI